MKVFRLFGIALVAILVGITLVSCGKDDEPTAAVESITGFWRVSETNDDFFSQDHAVSYLEFTATGTVLAYNYKKEVTKAWDNQGFYTLSGEVLQLDVNSTGEYPNHKAGNSLKGGVTLTDGRVEWRYKWSTEQGSWLPENYFMILEKAEK